MLKILQVRLQQHVNWELLDVQAGFRKAEEQEINLQTSAGSSKRPENTRKTSTSALLITPKPLTVWITTNCGHFWKMGIPDLLTCLLRNLCAGQEAAVRTGHGWTDWFLTGKVIGQGCILSPCVFNFYAEYIMGNARLDEASTSWNQIARRNINNLRYTDDITLMAQREQEVKSILMKV